MKRIFLGMWLGWVLVGCAGKSDESGPQGPHFKKISGDKQEGGAPSLWPTPEGGLIASWTEKEDATLRHTLCWAQMGPSDTAFGPAGRLPFTEGTSAMGEAGPQVVAAPKGLYAFWYQSAPHSSNPYAEAALWAFSTDKGNTWSRPLRLQPDSSLHAGQEFVTLTPTSSGLAAVWLEHVGDVERPGSRILFAMTDSSGRFQPPVLMDTAVCECCRPALWVGEKSTWVAYRALLPGGMRDIVVRESRDGGASFGAIEKPAAGGWKLEGCPVAGPSLWEENQMLHCLSFSGADGSGTWTESVRENGGQWAEKRQDPRKIKGVRLLAPGRLVWVGVDSLGQGAHWGGFGEAGNPLGGVASAHPVGAPLRDGRWVWAWVEKVGTDWPAVYGKVEGPGRRLTP